MRLWKCLHLLTQLEASALLLVDSHPRTRLQVVVIAEQVEATALESSEVPAQFIVQPVPIIRRRRLHIAQQVRLTPLPRQLIAQQVQLTHLHRQRIALHHQHIRPPRLRIALHHPLIALHRLRIALHRQHIRPPRLRIALHRPLIALHRRKYKLATGRVAGQGPGSDGLCWLLIVDC